VETEEFVEDTIKPKVYEGWLLSYSDVVTAMLCFFIIFYSIEKKVGSMNDQKKDQIILHDQVEMKSLPTELDTVFHSIEEKLESTIFNNPLIDENNITIEKGQNRFDIIFNGKVFFNQGSVQVLPAGKEMIGDLINVLKPKVQLLNLEIQGHSDNSKIIPQKGRWWQTNMELSVMRAISVYRYIERIGFEKKSLSVSGFGTNRSLSSNKNEVIDHDRRITLRVELKNKK